MAPESIRAQKCFLCGGQPTTGNGEHVFPKWLQRRYDLWDRTVGLINGTSIQYRNLTIPACQHCNSLILGKAEKFVSGLSVERIANWQESDSFEVGRWMAKLLLGILLKETALQSDRADRMSPSIVSPDDMQEFYVLHLLVQSWRKNVQFNCLHAAHPFTLYVYEILTDSEYEDFNFSTNIAGKSICLRLGNLGFAFAADGGLQHHLSSGGPFDLAFDKLHPLQFDELCARFHYKASLRDATHFYLNSEVPDEICFNQVRVVPNSSRHLQNGESRIFHPWHDEDLGRFLAMYQVSGWQHLLDRNGAAKFTRLVDGSGVKITL
ncbi:MAG: hypothetical protein ACSHXW_16610 [Yoonia sp.]